MTQPQRVTDLVRGDLLNVAMFSESTARVWIERNESGNHFDEGRPVDLLSYAGIPVDSAKREDPRTACFGRPPVIAVVELNNRRLPARTVTGGPGVGNAHCAA